MSKPALVGLALVLASSPVAAESWVFSETTSPLDYAPVIIASAWSSGADGATLQLSIQCRRGRTDLLILSPALTGRPEDHRLSYSVNNGAAVTLAVAAAPAGTGLSIRDDVVRLLAALPPNGTLVFQVALPRAAPIEGRYALGPLNEVLKRMAEPCKWPVRKTQPQ